VSDAENPSSELATTYEASPPAAPSNVGTVVRSWFATHLCNSPLSRATEAFNHVQAVLPALIEALEKKD
jgi:hypothetical protein